MTKRSADMAGAVAVVGSRAFPSPDVVQAFVGTLPLDCVVISGGANGVDTWAVEAARQIGLAMEVFEADWERLGRKAGPIRNAKIVARAARVVAFWDGRSRGTLNTLILAVEKGIPVEVFGSDGRAMPNDEAMRAARELGVFDALQRGRQVQSVDG